MRDSTLLRTLRLHSTRLLQTLALACAGAMPTAAADGPLVAVAANVTRAAEELASAHAAAGHAAPRLSFGSSGNFTRQIIQGAPFELFLSADEQYPRQLVAAGLTVDAGAVYAIGRLSLCVVPASGIDPALPPAERIAALPGMPPGHVALANPELAPYGRAAKEALATTGHWARLQPHLVLGENVAQAAQFLTSGAATAAFVPDAMAAESALAPFACSILPEDWHAPLRQRMVLVRGAGEAAADFYRFVLGPEGRAIIARHGYQLPP